MSKIYKYFFYLTISIIIVSLITLSFNSNLRRTTLSYLLSAYKIYMLVSIQSDLKTSNLNLISAEKKISKYLKNSKIIANGKSSLLIGIYDSINLIEKSIVRDKDFGIFENVLKEIVIIDPTLFKARVLLAKSLMSNKKFGEAKEQIKKALEINPLNHESYRILINLENNKKKVWKNICKEYLNVNLGGSKARYKNMIFTGYNINKFAVMLNPSVSDNDYQNELYTLSGINLNEFSDYEVIPTKQINLRKLNIYFSFLPRTILEVKEIKLYSEIKDYVISEKDVFITSKNTFFLNQDEAKKIIFTQLDNEIINIDLLSIFEKIEKIELVMKVTKSSLTNKICNQL